MPADYLLHAPSDEVRRLPWPKIIGFIIGAALLGMLFIYLENDRGNAHLRAMLDQLAERKIERLDPLQLRGNARKTALAINDAFERAMKEELSRSGGKPRRSVEDLDALLGPAPNANAEPFGDIPPPPPPAGAPPPPPRLNPAPAPFVPPAAAPGPAAAPAPAHAPPPPPAAAGGGPPRPPPPRAPGTTPAGNQGNTAVGLVAPPPGPAPIAATPPLNATMTADATGVVFANAGEEQAHWREVFDQFVATKKQCNEDVSALAFEKFAATLQKNKDQLVQRTQCRAVRFQVYVKDGKATLKASPVR
jgi:hypothetical protein